MLRFIFIAAFLLTANFAWAKSINQRQNTQKNRIKHGVKNGSLTKKETKKLVKNQAHIRRAERRAKADGNYTVKERAKIQNKLNKSSRRIYRAKHN